MSAPANPTVEEMTATAYAQWRHNPITQAVLQYLAHQVEADRAAVMELWISGALLTPPPHLSPEMLRGRIIALSETADLSLDQMQGFYRDARQTDDQATQEPQQEATNP